MKFNLLPGLVSCFVFAASTRAQTPQITSQPQSQLVNNGSTALFSVTATNASQYQWQFDGIPQPTWTNAQLVLDNVDATQAGTYTVTVTSGSFSMNSTPATLTVVPGTIVTLAITNNAGEQGGNVVVELFDHDKPATVANFLHYITYGSFTNMFFHRCVPGFVLQGGAYDAVDQTNTQPGLNLLTNLPMVGYFPGQLDSEYYLSSGAFTSNTFGTVAMALQAGNPNSATSSFFINLADNSDALDNGPSGEFTVFGRVISGSNFLEYFNTLTTNAGIIDYQDFDSDSSITQLPVNYIGTNEPSDANLYFCKCIVTNPPAENPLIGPSVAITYPTNNEIITNGLNVIMTGTAETNQWTGLANVECAFDPRSGFDATYFYNPFVNYANGTSNWSITLGNLPAGEYQVEAESQDGYGNVSSIVDNIFYVWSILTVAVNGPGTVTDQPGTPLGPNVTYFTNSGLTTYSMTAKPASGQAFAGWNNNGAVSLSPTIRFTVLNNMTLTANFVADSMPKGIVFTYPPANAKLTDTALTLKGKIPPSLNVTQATCEIFLSSNLVTAAQPVTRTGAAWSLPATNLAPGPYTAVLTAYDSQGRSRLISENFNVLAKVAVTNIGPGAVSPIRNGEYLEVGETYAVAARPTKPGYIFGYWSSGVTTTGPDTGKITVGSNTIITATFVTNPFSPVAGVYQGLFLSGSNATATNCGAISLRVSGSGAFSGALAFPNVVYPVNYTFDYTGSSVLGSTSGSYSTYLYLNLDLTNGTDELTGGVLAYSSGQILWSNALVAYRAVTKLNSATQPEPGIYDLLFAQTNDLPMGYAVLNATAGGAMVLSGAMADTVSFSQSHSVSKNGIWPVYYPARKGDWLLIGWETNSAEGCHGQLFWLTNGVSQTLNTFGTNNPAPANGSSYVIQFTGGTLGATMLSNTLAIANHRLTASTPDSDSLSIALSNLGVVSGTFKAGGATQTFKGVLRADGQTGGGFFINAAKQAGTFSIAPSP